MKRMVLPALAVAAALVTAAYVGIPEDDAVLTTSVGGGSSQVVEESPAATASVLANDSPPPQLTNPTDLTPSVIDTADGPMDDTSGVFPVDPSGRLILNQQTRLSLEAVLARTDPGQLHTAKHELQQTLPPQAAAQAIDLLDRYNDYQVAQKQAHPPGRTPGSEDEALAELDGLRALRIAHFGPAIAEAFYGSEEKLTRQLLELMRLEKDESLTLEEKAARAQAKLMEMPELSALHSANEAAQEQQ